MQDKTSRVTWRVLVALYGVLTAACARDDYYIVYERTELRGAERVSTGGGCALVLQGGGPLGGGSSSASGGDVEGDLKVDEASQRDGYQVVISSQGEELARRYYDRPFLMSHDIDVFEVTTHAGKRYEFSYRGSDDCDLVATKPVSDGGTASR